MLRPPKFVHCLGIESVPSLPLDPGLRFVGRHSITAFQLVDQCCACRVMCVLHVKHPEATARNRLARRHEERRCSHIIPDRDHAASSNLVTFAGFGDSGGSAFRRPVVNPVRRLTSPLPCSGIRNRGGLARLLSPRTAGPPPIVSFSRVTRRSPAKCSAPRDPPVQCPDGELPDRTAAHAPGSSR